MRRTEFWSRLERAVGPAHVRAWADLQVVAGLGNRTVTEALETGMDAKQVWAAVHAHLELPATDR